MKKAIGTLAHSATLVSFAFTALAMSGCGKSKASDEELARLAQTLDSAARVKSSVPQQAAPRVALDSALREKSPAIHWAASVLGVSSSGGSSRGAKTPAAARDEQARKMEDRLSSEKSCAVSMPAPVMPQVLGSNSSFSNINLPQFEIHISGQGCPVSLDMVLSATVNQTQLIGTFKCKYQVLESTYLPLNDVSGMDVEGGFSMSGSQSGGGSGKIDIQGTIHSQVHGDVKVSVSGDMTEEAGSQEGTVIASFEYEDFSIELKQKLSRGKVTYLINDDEVTEEEFNKAFGQSGLGSAVSEGQAESVESYSYEFDLGHCTTGKHRFSSLPAMCATLQSSALNRGCAEESRKRYFVSSGCPGQFAPRT